MKKIKNFALFGAFAVPMCFGVSGKFLSSESDNLTEIDLELRKIQTASGASCPGYEPTYYATSCDIVGWDACVNYCC